MLSSLREPIVGMKMRLCDSSPRCFNILLLFGLSGMVAVCTATAQTVCSSMLGTVERIQNLAPLWLLDNLLDYLDLDLVLPLPLLTKRPFNLPHSRSLFQFMPFAIAANVVVCWSIALIFLTADTLVATIYHAARPGVPARRRQVAYAAALLVVFSFPFLLFTLHTFNVRSTAAQVCTTLALSLAAWAGLVFILRRPPWRQRSLLAGTLVTVTCILTTITGRTVVYLQGAPYGDITPPGPNILLVSIDSLRADHLHSYGYSRETSPTIDALAREGALFTTAVAPTSWTLPSHLTLLTSLSPAQHGVVLTSGQRLAPGVPTLPEVLRTAGYQTGGFVSGPFLRAEYGFSRGFDHYDDFSVVARTVVDSYHGVTSPRLSANVKQWLKEWSAKGRRRPFFAFVHMWDVHYDYSAPEPYRHMFDPDYAGTLTADNFVRNRNIHKNMDPRDLEHIIALYDGEIRFTDYYLGELIGCLRDLGVLEETIIVVTSDHGDEFFEHGNGGHHKTLYDEVIRVPLIVRFPEKIEAGTVIEEQVRLEDIGLTILALADVANRTSFGRLGPSEVGQVSRDLSPILARGSTILDAIENGADDNVAFGELFRGKLKVSLRTKELKLIGSYDEDGFGVYELYDLTADPTEQVNLFEKRKELASELVDRLLEWLRASGARGEHSANLRVDDRQLRLLRSLGYVE